MGGAGKQMSGSMDRAAAGGAGRGGPGHANSRLVRVKKRAVAGAELGQGGAVGSGKGQFFALDKRGRGLEDRVWCELTDGISHRGCMEVFEGGLVGGGVGGSIC